jgi:hypothetical protein
MRGGLEGSPLGWVLFLFLAFGSCKLVAVSLMKIDGRNPLGQKKNSSDQIYVEMNVSIGCIKYKIKRE